MARAVGTRPVHGPHTARSPAPRLAVPCRMEHVHSATHPSPCWYVGTWHSLRHLPFLLRDSRFALRASRFAVPRSYDGNRDIESLKRWAGMFSLTEELGVSMHDLAVASHTQDVNKLDIPEVRVASRSIPPRSGSIRFRFPPRTYDAPPWGVRVVSLAKSRKIPTRKTHYRCFPCMSRTRATGPPNRSVPFFPRMAGQPRFCARRRAHPRPARGPVRAAKPAESRTHTHTHNTHTQTHNTRTYT